MNCEYCQSPVHIWFQCPKKPDGWIPARLAKKSVSGRKTDADEPLSRLPPKSASDDKSGRSQIKSTAARKDVRSSPSVLPTREAGGAGTQALPVDTNGSEAQKVERRSPKPEDAGSIPATSANAGSSNGRTSGFDPVNVGSTPAPASKFDKKAWMKAYMKTYIRQYREDVKSGKRTPKPRA